MRRHVAMGERLHSRQPHKYDGHPGHPHESTHVKTLFPIASGAG
jgi:hypothetical protein